MERRPPTPTLFPYTTLFRSQSRQFVKPLHQVARGHRADVPDTQAEQQPRRIRRALGVDRRQQVIDRLVLPPFPDDKSVEDRKSTRLKSSHPSLSYAVFCLKK